MIAKRKNKNSARSAGSDHATKGRETTEIKQRRKNASLNVDPIEVASKLGKKPLTVLRLLGMYPKLQLKQAQYWVDYQVDSGYFSRGNRRPQEYWPTEKLNRLVDEPQQVFYATILRTMLIETRKYIEAGKFGIHNLQFVAQTLRSVYGAVRAAALYSTTLPWKFTLLEKEQVLAESKELPLKAVFSGTGTVNIYIYNDDSFPFTNREDVEALRQLLDEAEEALNDLVLPHMRPIIPSAGSWRLILLHLNVDVPADEFAENGAVNLPFGIYWERALGLFHIYIKTKSSGNTMLRTEIQPNVVPPDIESIARDLLQDGETLKGSERKFDGSAMLMEHVNRFVESLESAIDLLKNYSNDAEFCNPK